MNEPGETEAQVSGLLGPRDARILDAFMVTGSIPKAAKIVGIDRSTAWRVSKTRGFQDELRGRLDEQARVSRLRLLEHQDPAWIAIGGVTGSPESGPPGVRLTRPGRAGGESHEADETYARAGDPQAP